MNDGIEFSLDEMKDALTVLMAATDVMAKRGIDSDMKDMHSNVMSFIRKLYGFISIIDGAGKEVN